MTREEAIRAIGWLKCTTNREDDLEAIDMAIEALQTDAVMRDATSEERASVQRYIDSISTEAVQVVRCKDCRHHGMSACPMWEGSITDDYMWCSWGEGREE